MIIGRDIPAAMISLRILPMCCLLLFRSVRHPAISAPDICQTGKGQAAAVEESCRFPVGPPQPFTSTPCIPLSCTGDSFAGNGDSFYLAAPLTRPPRKPGCIRSIIAAVLAGSISLQQNDVVIVPNDTATARTTFHIRFMGITPINDL